MVPPCPRLASGSSGEGAVEEGKNGVWITNNVLTGNPKPGMIWWWNDSDCPEGMLLGGRLWTLIKPKVCGSRSSTKKGHHTREEMIAQDFTVTNVGERRCHWPFCSSFEWDSWGEVQNKGEAAVLLSCLWNFYSVYNVMMLDVTFQSIRWLKNDSYVSDAGQTHFQLSVAAEAT